MIEEADDHILLQSIAQSKNHAAFASLFDRYKDNAYAIALRMTGNGAMAEDAVQEAMIVLWNGARSWRGEGTVRSWLLRIVALKSLELRRSNKRLERSNMGLSSKENTYASTAMDGDETVCHLQQAISALSLEDQQILTLYYGMELPQDEVATMLNIKQRTVSQRIQKLLANLRINLTQAGVAAVAPLGVAVWDDALCGGVTAPSSLCENVLKLPQAVRSESRATRRRVQRVKSNIGAGAATAITGAAVVAIVLGALWLRPITPLKAVQATHVASVISPPATAPLSAGMLTKNNEFPGWNLVWSDEFDYTGLPDPKKWSYDTGFGQNGELQYNTAARSENARVENGTLIIEARKEHFANPNFKPGGVGDDDATRAGAEYTSASLSTLNKAVWKHGRIELKLQMSEGKGTWSYIWMLGENFKVAGAPACGQIDIAVNVGIEPETVHSFVHTAAVSSIGHAHNVSHLADDFHVYAMEWTSSSIDFFIDNVHTFTCKKKDGANPVEWPFDQPLFLLLNLGVGGNWGGKKGVDDSSFPQRLLVKYVRVYQRAEGQSTR